MFGVICSGPYLIQKANGERSFIPYLLQGMIDVVLELPVHGQFLESCFFLKFLFSMSSRLILVHIRVDLFFCFGLPCLGSSLFGRLNLRFWILVSS